MATNLDMECARLGAQLAEISDDDKTLTDALSVLEAQGVYAFFLYLAQKKERRPITKACRVFLGHHLPGESGSGDGDVFKTIQDIAGDLDRLLLARDLLRQSLIYARYHAKARSVEAKQ